MSWNLADKMHEVQIKSSSFKLKVRVEKKGPRKWTQILYEYSLHDFSLISRPRSLMMSETILGNIISWRC